MEKSSVLRDVGEDLENGCGPAAVESAPDAVLGQTAHLDTGAVTF